MCSGFRAVRGYRAVTLVWEGSLMTTLALSCQLIVAVELSHERRLERHGPVVMAMLRGAKTLITKLREKHNTCRG